MTETTRMTQPTRAAAACKPKVRFARSIDLIDEHQIEISENFAEFQCGSSLKKGHDMITSAIRNLPSVAELVHPPVEFLSAAQVVWHEKAATLFNASMLRAEDRGGKR